MTRLLSCLAVIASVAAACGCRLVDQTSFGNMPRAPAPDALTAALASHGAEPLLVIRADEGVPYMPLLRAALEAAPGGSGRFRLEAVASPGRSLDDTEANLSRAATEAGDVLSAMEEDGVPADHVVLTTRADPAVAQTEIRLYPG